MFGELLVHLYRATAMSLEGAPENAQVIDDDSQPIPKESGVGSRWEQLASSSKDQAGNQIVFDLDWHGLHRTRRGLDIDLLKSWQRVVQSWDSLYPNTHTHWQQKNLRNPFQNQWLICLESSWSLYIRNPQGNPFKIKPKLVCNAHGQFAYGILKIQNQHESGLASSWSIYDNFLLISRNRLGELLVGLHVETLRSSSQNQFGLCLENSWSIYTWNP